MEIKPIRNETDYYQALEEIENLLDVPSEARDGDKLEVLLTLVDAYEEMTDPILPPDPIDAILHYLESQNLSIHDLEPYIGDQERVTSVLERKRPLTLDMIRKLRAGLGIPADVLIQPYELEVA